MASESHHDFFTYVFSHNPQPPFSININANLNSKEDMIKLVTGIFIKGIAVKFKDGLVDQKYSVDYVFSEMNNYFMSFGFTLSMTYPDGTTVPFESARKTFLRDYALQSLYNGKYYTIRFDLLNNKNKCR